MLDSVVQLQQLPVRGHCCQKKKQLCGKLLKKASVIDHGNVKLYISQGFVVISQLTEQLLPRAAGYLFNLHAGQRHRVSGRDERSRRRHRRGRCCEHFVDQRRLQRSLDAPAHQITQRNLEDVLTCHFTW